MNLYFSCVIFFLAVAVLRFLLEVPKISLLDI